ncbi:MAG TPA: hypothetical protein VHH09_03485 [Acidimicrobiales bacterium]|nr:hypothetical protein [Acidimicrobiales bacterium]
MAGSLRSRLTAGEMVIIGSAAVSLLFSFFPWYGDPFDRSAWGSGLFPLATLVPILAGVMLVQILVDKLSVASLPARLGDFTWEQIHLVAAVGAAVIVFCFLLQDRGGTDLGLGFYFNLLAVAGLVTGAVLIRRERRGGLGPPA